MAFGYQFPGDESFAVIEGRVRIELEDGSGVLEFGAGDIASFRKGTRSTWTILESILKFTVVSG